MSALVSDYTGNTVLIYNTDGFQITSAVIDDYDKHTKQIQFENLPDGLRINDECKLLILATPSPCEFSGKVKKVGGSIIIGMFQGQEKENRIATRYPVTTPALITTFIIDSKPHPIKNPIAVTLINISTSGVRFRAPYYSLETDDEFEMHLIINNTRKKITARVVNSLDGDNITHTDYGCSFLIVE